MLDNLQNNTNFVPNNSKYNIPTINIESIDNNTLTKAKQKIVSQASEYYEMKKQNPDFTMRDYLEYRRSQKPQNVELT